LALVLTFTTTNQLWNKLIEIGFDGIPGTNGEVAIDMSLTN
jgi:hypothetical protein